ncbi:coiled-coil domain-containing protein 86-like [Pomacea canaliculata]|uniref:coiled-coil domain-containing protein 86-like n=1 Tax=Pomacea canaliculata TaxID=400727 RepID=UPI000D727AC9|nr:coiled-coil domain-containing protein 86-like [Pomacea canaliculata]
MESEANALRGKPKSGRVWKRVRTNRFSDFLRVKCQKTSWEEKMAKKKEQQAIKDLEKKLKEQKIEKIQLKRQRREENKKRRLENERRAEIVQPIKNTRKLKRIKKKQLRQIEKR